MGVMRDEETCIPGAVVRARRLRQDMTDAERKVWRFLRARQTEGFRFRRQVPFGRYIADFVCHEAALVIEIDGGQHDAESPAEIQRSKFLEAQGYRIIRFWNDDVLANAEGVYVTIVENLGRHHPHPNPPPSRGRESRRPVVGCLAVVKRGETILLVQRSKAPGIGKWGFPGGHLEMGETVSECAVRELDEETAIEAEALRVLTAFDFITHDDAGTPTGHYTLIAILCDWRGGDGETIEDASALGWFTLAEAERLDTFPDALPAMRLALAADPPRKR